MMPRTRRPCGAPGGCIVTFESESQNSGWLVRKSTQISSFSDLSRILLTLAAGFIAFWQVNAQWQVENERAARLAFREFLTVSMNNPAYSRPDLLERPFTSLEYEQYFWYVNFMSQTFEEVFAYVPEVDAWVDLAETQIALHCAFFDSDEYVPELYSQRFQDTVARIIAENPMGACR